MCGWIIYLVMDGLVNKGFLDDVCSEGWIIVSIHRPAHGFSQKYLPNLLNLN